MKLLKHDTKEAVTPGDYNFIVTANGGTATLQIAPNGVDFQDMVGGSYTADANDLISFTGVPIKVQLTGGAQAYIGQVRR